MALGAGQPLAEVGSFLKGATRPEALKPDERTLSLRVARLGGSDHFYGNPARWNLAHGGNKNPGA